MAIPGKTLSIRYYTYYIILGINTSSIMQQFMFLPATTRMRHVAPSHARAHLPAHCLLSPLSLPSHETQRLLWLGRLQHDWDISSVPRFECDLGSDG